MCAKNRALGVLQLVNLISVPSLNHGFMEEGCVFFPLFKLLDSGFLSLENFLLGVVIFQLGLEPFLISSQVISPVDVCSFVRHRLCPPGWQRMGDVDFVVPFVFSEDETMWRTIVGAL